MKTQDWLNALRSGNYGQTKEELADGHGNFCCLGVLCEVAGIPKTENHIGDNEVMVEYVFQVPKPVQMMYYMGAETTADACLPDFASKSLLEDLDLTQTVPAMEDGPEEAVLSQRLHDRLMNLNDGGWTFEQIADYIQSVRDAK